MSALQSLLKSDGAALPPKQSVSNILLAGIGGFVAIAVLAYLAQSLEAVLVLGSFGASCVLVFGFPEAPFSQPRNVVVGHLLSSFVGLLFLTLCGPTWWSVALAAGTAIALMIATRTIHPPAGSNPVIVFLTQPAWDFLLFPTLTGALLVVVVAVLYNNLVRKTNYPKYW